MPPAPELVLVVAHTHWDREWYHTAERFRQRLVPLVDALLDDPPTAGTSFLLDGQAILLDDYLTVRPERAGELAAQLREGRLEAGPWFVLADELIPGGEALVRNLLAGRETVRRLRGEPPPVLYCPDSFGHPAILPELAHGFGCPLVILWRGYGGARWPAGDTVRWRGPTGAEVLVHHLAPDGYELGSSLPRTATDAAARWERLSGILLPRATTGVTLLLNGADHHARQRGQNEAVAVLAAVASPVRIVPSTLRAAADAVHAAARPASLPVIEGELRDSYGYTWTLGGTLATRASQKRRNALAERSLVRDVEPWIALAGSPADRASLDAAWRDLLRGHPHDTLCGTSIDAVAAALDQRLASVDAQAAGLRESAIASLLRHDVERARDDAAHWRPALVIRNRAARMRSGVATVTVAITVANVAVGPGSATRQGVPHEPEMDFAAAGLQVLARERRVALTEAPRAYPRADLVEEIQALAWVQHIGGYSAQATLLNDLALGAPPRPVGVDGWIIDNGHLRVSVDPSGDIRLEEPATGRVVERLVSLVLERDVGDLYTPAIRERLPALVFDGCDVVHAGPLRGELALRHRDADGLGDLVLRVALDAELAALRLTVQGTNARSDARLRLVVAGDAGEAAGVRGGSSAGSAPAAGAVGGAVGGAVAGSVAGTVGGTVGGSRGGPPTGKIAARTEMHDTDPSRAVSPAEWLAGSPPRTVADAAFHPLERLPIGITDDDAAMEHVVPTAPLHRYVSRYAARGTTVFSDGLTEYESMPGGGIAVTLWRAVGELSRADLPERPGHAGWPVRTPAAQCHGPYAAELAVALHGADTPVQRDDIERLADDVLLPLAGETLRSNLRDATTSPGIELEGEGLAFSAAMPARRSGWIVLRCVNRRAEPVRGRWRLGRAVEEACAARLDETPGDALPVSAGHIDFDAPPMAIVTVLARL